LPDKTRLWGFIVICGAGVASETMPHPTKTSAHVSATTRVKNSSNILRNAKAAMILSVFPVGTITSTYASQILLLYHAAADSCKKLYRRQFGSLFEPKATTPLAFYKSFMDCVARIIAALRLRHERPCGGPS
jgi:hypothetical protein